MHIAMAYKVNLALFLFDYVKNKNDDTIQIINIKQLNN